MDHKTFFDQLWQDYIQIAPGVETIHDAVATREKCPVKNDHVAFRTFDRLPINLESLEKHLISLGYNRFAPYEFKEKKLRAFGYLHPDEDAPRVFLSELKTDEFSHKLRDIVDHLIEQIDVRRMSGPEVLCAGRLWEPVSFEDYEQLAAESEYAAWVAALGLRANHFTISVNQLQSMQTLQELLDFVEKLGFKLNEAGGRVKGSPEVLLEQGSTLAMEREIEFANGRKEKIPTCYYEFARRYPDPESGKIYNGFVAASADKIFESTDRAR